MGFMKLMWFIGFIDMDKPPKRSGVLILNLYHNQTLKRVT